MNGAPPLLLSLREKRISLVVAVVLAVLLVDLAFRSWGAVWAGMEREEKKLGARWDYVARLLARSRYIKERYDSMRSRYPQFFEEGRDLTRLMAELDEAAKEAGVQVAIIRPSGSDLGVEMMLRGSWPAVSRFFQTVEGHDPLLQVSQVNVRRKEQGSELEIAVMVRKR